MPIVQGSPEHPVALDPFQRIVAVHWPGIVYLRFQFTPFLDSDTLVYDTRGGLGPPVDTIVAWQHRTWEAPPTIVSASIPDFSIISPGGPFGILFSFAFTAVPAGGNAPSWPPVFADSGIPFLAGTTWNATVTSTDDPPNPPQLATLDYSSVAITLDLGGALGHRTYTAIAGYEGNFVDGYPQGNAVLCKWDPSYTPPP